MSKIDKLCKLVSDAMAKRQLAKPQAERSDQRIPKADADELEKRRIMRQVEEWRINGF